MGTTKEEQAIMQNMKMLTAKIQDDLATIEELGFILKRMTIEGDDLGNDAQAFPCAASFGRREFTRTFGRAIEAVATSADSTLEGLTSMMKRMEVATA